LWDMFQNCPATTKWDLVCFWCPAFFDAYGTGFIFRNVFLNTVVKPLWYKIHKFIVANLSRHSSKWSHNLNSWLKYVICCVCGDWQRSPYFKLGFCRVPIKNKLRGFAVCL
jgi:hypothetical protein